MGMRLITDKCVIDNLIRYLFCIKAKTVVISVPMFVSFDIR